MQQFLKTKSSIKAWLSKHGVEHYKLVPSTIYGYKVDVKGDLELRHTRFIANRRQRFASLIWSGQVNNNSGWVKKIRHIPVKFNSVEYNVRVSNQGIKNLRWAPTKVGDGFCLDYNNLKNLYKFPKKIGGSIILNSNRLTSLKGMPKMVMGSINLSKNFSLKSLVGAPLLVDGNFLARQCALPNLIGSPEYVSGSCQYQKSGLRSLEGISQFIGGDIDFGNSISFYYALSDRNNEIEELDFWPEQINGDIYFEGVVGLDRYKELKIGDIINMAKLEKKAKEEHMLLDTQIAQKNELDKNQKNMDRAKI